RHAPASSTKPSRQRVQRAPAPSSKHERFSAAHWSAMLPGTPRMQVGAAGTQAPVSSRTSSAPQGTGARGLVSSLHAAKSARPIAAAIHARFVGAFMGSDLREVRVVDVEADVGERAEIDVLVHLLVLLVEDELPARVHQ